MLISYYEIRFAVCLWVLSLNLGSKCWKDTELYYVINERCGFYSRQWTNLIFFWYERSDSQSAWRSLSAWIIIFMLTINCLFLLLVTKLFFPIFAFFFLNQNVCFIYLCEYLAAWVSLCHVCAWCPQSSEEGMGCSEAEVTDGCEPPCGCWELNLGLLQEKVPLTTEL